MKGLSLHSNSIEKSAVYTILLILISVFLIDINFPSIRNFWLIYFLPIFITAWKVKNKNYIYSITSLCIVLILLVFFIVPSGYANYIALSNRLIGIIIIISFVILLLQKMKVEISLSEREKQFYNTIMHNPLPMLIRTEDEKIILINNAFTEISGYSLEDIPTVTAWTEKAYGEKAGQMKEYVTDLFTENRRIDAGEFEITTKDGEKRIWHFIIAPLGALADGRRTVITTAFDLTERKKSELLLSESEKKFRAIAESMPQIVWTAKPDGILDYFNSRGVEFTGEKLIEGKYDLNWLKFIHPNDFPAAKRMWQNSLNTGELFELTFRLKQHDDKYCWFLTRAIPLLNDEGKIIKWLGTSTDIQHQKEVQERLIDALQKLVENEEKLIEVQKITNVGSYVFNVIENSIEWSEVAYNILGKNSSENVLTVDNFFIMVHPDDIEKVREGFNNIITKKEPLSIEHRIILEDESIKYLHKIGKPIIDDKDNVTKVIGAITDITERKLIHMKLEQTLEELSRSNKDLEQFAYTVSHDLQEPIRMIKGYSKLVNDRYTEILDEKARSFLEFILEGATRMQQLISDLLKYSRITSKAKSFDKVDCNSIIKDVLTDLQFQIIENDVSVDCENLPVLNGDQTQLRQLFQNLIQNAIKFKREINPEIIIKCKKRRKEYLFSIEDNGIGIEKESYERIFEIFQRLHERNKYEGTGIGLAICKKIIERHNGKIWIESELDKGSTFYFTIPFME